MKDFVKATEKGRELINSRRDLKLEQMRILLDEVAHGGRDGAFDAISKAYYAGFIQGYEQAENKRRAS